MQNTSSVPTTSNATRSARTVRRVAGSLIVNGLGYLCGQYLMGCALRAHRRRREAEQRDESRTAAHC